MSDSANKKRRTESQLTKDNYENDEAEDVEEEVS